MGSPVVATPAGNAEPPKSFIERFIGVFISPGETFADIARKPDFIVPLLVTIVMMVAGLEIFMAKIGLEPIVRYALEHSSRAASASPEQLDQMIATTVKIQRISFHVIGFIYAPFLCLIDALLGLLFVRAIFGGDLRFKTAFSIPAYAFLLQVIPGLMGFVLVFFGDPEHMITNPQNPVPSSLGFFLNPADVSKPIMALASAFDIFTIWYIVLLGIGYSAASKKKVSTLTSYFCFFGLWIVWVVMRMGLSLLQ
jgi:Yip1 domain